MNKLKQNSFKLKWFIGFMFINNYNTKQRFMFGNALKSKL